MRAIIDSLATDSGYICDRELHVMSMTGAGQWLADGNPAILLDATLPLQTRAIIEAQGGEVIEIFVKQNVIVRRRPNHYFGMGKRHVNNPSNQQADSAAWKKYHDSSLKMALDTLDELPKDGTKRALLTHLRWTENLTDDQRAGLASQGIDVKYFGVGDRAHDQWKFFNLSIVGGPTMSSHSMVEEYGLARFTALRGGASPVDWPAWLGDLDGADDDEDLKDLDLAGHNGGPPLHDWIDEGSGAEVACRAPLPKKQRVREWILDRYAGFLIQAIGRVRAARSSKTLYVDIWGGLPFEYSKYGIAIDSYHDNDGMPWKTREQHNEEQTEDSHKRFLIGALWVYRYCDKTTEKAVNQALKNVFGLKTIGSDRMSKWLPDFKAKFPRPTPANKFNTSKDIKYARYVEYYVDNEKKPIAIYSGLLGNTVIEVGIKGGKIKLPPGMTVAEYTSEFFKTPPDLENAMAA